MGYISINPFEVENIGQNAFNTLKLQSSTLACANVLRILPLAYSGQNLLMQNLFYRKVKDSLCNLWNTVLRVINRMVV